MEYDVFISHAHEDKDSVARPLTARLRELGVKVWLDEFELKLGDSLRRSVERGLSQSKFGVVILSQNFFRKEWTKRELDALLSKEETAQKVILPIWHEITKEDVFKFSPLLADKLAASTEKGIENVAQQILSVVKFVEKEEALIESAVEEITVYDKPPVEIKTDYDLNPRIERTLSILTNWKYVAASLIFVLFAAWLIDLSRRPDLSMKDNSNTADVANNNNTNQAVTATPLPTQDESEFIEFIIMPDTSKLSVKGCRLDIKPYIYCELYNGIRDRIIIRADIEVIIPTPSGTEKPRQTVSLAANTLVDSIAEISGNPLKTSLYRGDWTYDLDLPKLDSKTIKVMRVVLKRDMSIIEPQTSPSPLKLPTPKSLPLKESTPKPSSLKEPTPKPIVVEEEEPYSDKPDRPSGNHAPPEDPPVNT